MARLVSTIVSEPRAQKEAPMTPTIIRLGEGERHLDLLTRRYILDAWRAAL